MVGIYEKTSFWNYLFVKQENIRLRQRKIDKVNKSLTKSKKPIKFVFSLHLFQHIAYSFKAII